MLHANYCQLLCMLGEWDGAMTHAKWAMAFEPGKMEPWNNAGTIYSVKGNFKEALKCFEKAVALAPNHHLLLNNYGDCLNNLGRCEEAIQVFIKALSIKNNPELVSNLGLANLGKGDFFAAESCFREAIKQKPYAQTHRNLGAILLATGKYAEGWMQYEHRFAADNIKPRTLMPRWDGAPTDKHLWVTCEQGLGDHILHASMAGDLLKLIPNVTWETDARLIGLFSRAFPQINFVKPETEAMYDIHCPALSLGTFLRKSEQDFPKEKYLSCIHPAAHPDQSTLRVGVSWESKNPIMGEMKTCPLSEWAPLWKLPVDYLNLQYGTGWPDLKNTPISHANVDLKMDIESVASLIESCDLVITVSNTTAHLACALGVPTIVMVPGGTGKLWYWGTGDTTPWHPTAELHRGKSWPEIIEKVRLSLESRVSAARTSAQLPTSPASTYW